MMRVMVSPCSVCGWTLEHDQDPRTVLCGGCEADARVAARKNAPPPPPTVEYHRRVPPMPPPMRNPHHTPTWFEPGYRVLSIAAVLALGFLLGWIARGGA